MEVQWDAKCRHTVLGLAVSSGGIWSEPDRHLVPWFAFSPTGLLQSLWDRDRDRDWHRDWDRDWDWGSHRKHHWFRTGWICKVQRGGEV